MAKRVNKTISKDPDSTMDFNIDWEEWLEGDSITTSSWSVPAGLVVTGTVFAASGLATIWLAGGTVGDIYTITNTITTAFGRDDQRSLVIVIVER
jgi:hypothetical protein